MSEARILPAMITARNYPALFALDIDYSTVPLMDIIADAVALKDRLDFEADKTAETIRRRLNQQESNISSYPRTTDPATQRFIIEKKFEKNGIKVTLRGNEPSILAAMNVLEKYPPSGPVTVLQDKWYGFGECETYDTTPTIGMNDKDGEHVELVYPNGSVYSGSGVLVFLNIRSADQIKTAGVDYSQVYIPVFREVASGKYADLGGRIEKPEFPNDNTLYANALREAREESANFLDLNLVGDNDENRVHVDITNDNVNGPRYRSYISHLKINGRDSLDKIASSYKTNTAYIRSNPVYNAEYRETDDIRFISLASLITKLGSMSGTPTDTNILDINGAITPIRGRTMRVFAQAVDKAVLTKALSSDNQKKVIAKSATPIIVVSD